MTGPMTYPIHDWWVTDHGAGGYTVTDRWDWLDGHVRVEQRPATHRDVAQATIRDRMRTP